MTDPTDLEKLIVIHQRRLQKLKEQQAKLGAHTPPYILLEIEDGEAELARLQGQVGQATGSAPSSAAPSEAVSPENPTPIQSPPFWSTPLNAPPGGAMVALGETLFVPTWPQVAPQAAHLHRLRLASGQAAQPPLVFEGVLVSGLAAAPEAGLLLVGLYDLDPLGTGGALLALDETGAERWRWPAQTGAVSAPTVRAETVWVTTNQAELIGLALATGEVKARHPLETSPYLVAPAVSAGRAFVAGRKPALVAVGLEGQPGWQFQPEPPGRVETTPWLDSTGERLFVAVSETGLVLAVSVETGTVLWQTRVGPVGKPLGPLTGDSQRLLAGSRAGLHALDPASGELLWQQPLARGVQAAPVVVEGLVYAAGRDRQLSAFESATGQPVWAGRVERRLEQPPLIVRVPHPLALVVDHGGAVTALRRPLSLAEQPRLSVSLEHDALAFQSWSRLRFVVHNQGDSAARQVVIRAKGGQFEGQVAETRQLMTLAAGQIKDDWLDLRPLAHGDSVPLRLTIDYRDEAGQPHTWQETRYLPVSAEPVEPGSRMARVYGTKKPGPALGPIRQRWALLVGVNHYIDPTLGDLKYCVNDVLVLGNQLEKLGYTVVSLHDEAAEERLLPDSENIEAELTRLCQAAEPDDLIWVHFAGHGLVVEEQPLLLTCRSRRDILPKSSLLLTDLEQRLRDSGVRRLALTLDACHVGVEIGRDATDPDFVRHAHDLAEGFALLAAGTARQVAQETSLTQHGLFTYYLLEGLAGQAARHNNSFVTVDDLKTYVLDRLRRWSIQHGGFLQEPTARTEGLGDMILADFRLSEPLA